MVFSEMVLRRVVRLSDMSIDQGFLSRRVRVLPTRLPSRFPPDMNEPLAHVRKRFRASPAANS